MSCGERGNGSGSIKEFFFDFLSQLFVFGEFQFAKLLKGVALEQEVSWVKMLVDLQLFLAGGAFHGIGSGFLKPSFPPGGGELFRRLRTPGK